MFHLRPLQKKATANLSSLQKLKFNDSVVTKKAKSVHSCIQKDNSNNKSSFFKTVRSCNFQQKMLQVQKY